MEHATAVVGDASCGLIMPISALDGATAEHWAEVKGIITEAVESIAEPKFSVRLVSDADDIGVIQKRIVQNVYSSDVVVCDVSGKNPNVMFELGLRLAFDKPTIIVKDDKTDYSFDTAVIEHVGYPRDLRFNKIVAFKDLLATKVQQTYRAATENPDHSVFLKNFGKFQVAALSEQEVPAQTLTLQLLQDIQSEMATLAARVERPTISRRAKSDRPEIIAQLTASIIKHKKSRKIASFARLINDHEFYNDVASDVTAIRYYDTYDEFRDVMDTLLKALEASK